MKGRSWIICAALSGPMWIISYSFSTVAEFTFTCPVLQPLPLGGGSGVAVGKGVAVGWTVGVGVGSGSGVAVGTGVAVGGGTGVAVGTGVFVG